MLIWPTGAMARLTANQRGYTWAWHKARDRFLLEHPVCKMCKDVGRVAKATVVDHVIPHNGDKDLFWDDGNWQALCATCHSRHKQRIEKGVVQQVGDDGWPLGNRSPRVRVPRVRRVQYVGRSVCW